MTSKSNGWQLCSRIVGISIILSLLATFLTSQALNRHVDAPIALAFLGIASGLIGAPDGWIVVRRGNERRNGR